jgi:hypothetical protein
MSPVPARRFLVRLATLALALVAVLGQVAPVAAWANGGHDWSRPDPNNGDGYGTHDWIIDEALAVMGGRPPWFDRQTAVWASDDPDTIPTTDFRHLNDHVYRNVGGRGGAINEVSELYDTAMADYKRGKAAAAAGDATGAHNAYEAASYHIGLLAHYYGDLLQPYHTAYAGIGQASHVPYELLVDHYTHYLGAMPAWQSTRRSVAAVSNIRTKAIAAAAYSRSFFDALLPAFLADENNLTPTVSTITRNVLVRAENDLADIIYSIGQGVGAQPLIGHLTASAHWVYPAQNYPYEQVIAKATDVAGKAIEGLGIDVTWPLGTGGTKRVRMFTDETGTAHYTDTVGPSPLYARRTASVTASTNGHALSATTWWMATPVLADAQAGIKTTVNDATVAPGQTITVSTVLHDTTGAPVHDVAVDWTWTMGSAIYHSHALTDSNGRARSSRLISTTTALGTLTVQGHAQSGSHNRYSSASFHRVS